MQRLGVILAAFSLSVVFVWPIEPGPFRNLDFELAKTNSVAAGQVDPYVAGLGPVEDLLPYWRVAHREEQLDFVNFNLLGRGGGVSLISKDALIHYEFLYPGGIFPGGIEGDFGLAFSTDDTPFFLAQTGVVSGDAEILLIDWISNGNVRMEARVNGTLIENGDISAFAGQMVELELRMWRVGLSILGQEIGLNRISFARMPALSVQRTDGNDVLVFWPRLSRINLILQQSEKLGGGSWNDVAKGGLGSPTHDEVVLPIENGQRFFRLTLR